MDLQTLTKNISITKFNKTFNHKATYNKRLKTSGGRYILKTHNIEINPKFENHELLEQIIIHELCHYHLHIEKKGYQHKDKDFKDLLKLTNGIRFVPRINEPKYTYQCKSCMQKYFRERKINTNKYRCGKCQGQLILTTKRDV